VIDGRLAALLEARSMAARLESCWQSWPAPLAEAARQYFSRRPADGRVAVPRGRHLDYPWLLLPIWLMTAFRPRPTRADVAWLREVLWGQYTLYLVVRIHDDVFDGQASGPFLVYVGDRFLLESEQAFDRHVDVRFWPTFRAALVETLSGIVEVDALQRRRVPPGPKLLRAYARVSAIFKVGAAAVCLRCARTAAFPRIARFKDELAMASQILDDLLDMEEDLARGRRNYVASVVLGAARAAPGRQDVLDQIGARIVLGDGLQPVLDEVGRHLTAAGRAIAPLGLPPAESYVAQLQRHLARLRQEVHRTRVEKIFRITS
jgi:hypothetical protein